MKQKSERERDAVVLVANGCVHNGAKVGEVVRNDRVRHIIIPKLYMYKNKYIKNSACRLVLFISSLRHNLKGVGDGMGVGGGLVAEGGLTCSDDHSGCGCHVTPSVGKGRWGGYDGFLLLLPFLVKVFSHK